MRFIPCVGAVLLFGAVALGQNGFFSPMKGSATPEFETTSDNVRCLVFGKHIVKTTQSEDGGENVSLWMREGTAKGTAACNVHGEPYARIRDSDNNSFYGISAVYLFIDTGTSAGARVLQVYKTDSGDDVTEVAYFAGENAPRIEAARYLFYDELSTKKGPASACPNAAKWKRQGGSVGWVQGKKMDLNTQQAINVGGLRCVYME